MAENMYDGEDWAEFLKTLGFNPYDTESAAREVARGAIKEIVKLEKLIYNYVDPSNVQVEDYQQVLDINVRCNLRSIKELNDG